MTPEAQRIAIAEACGVKPMLVEWMAKHPTEDSICLGCETKRDVFLWLLDLPEGSPYKCYIPTPRYRYPDYLNDLNAMAEAEKLLTLLQFWKYADSLRGLCDARGLGQDEYIAATASQRAEAFLRTLNLWVEPTTATKP